MRILVATDLFPPMVNGVVRTYQALAAAVAAQGDELVFLPATEFFSIPLGRDAEMRAAFASQKAIGRRFAELRPDAVHIATEFLFGISVMRYCRTRNLPFTTSYHTRLPEYLAARFPVPIDWTWAWLRWFHNSGAGVMTPTPAIAAELVARGIPRVLDWPLGVDVGLFRPRAEAVLDLPRPVFLTVARLAAEKNLDAFLRLDLPGTKVVVGDGALRRQLGAAFPDAVFLGLLEGEALARAYASADVFVFPSVSDTYGLVMLEALASGLPVAAYPAPATRALIGDAPVGILGEDLRAACLGALEIDRAACRRFAEARGWASSAASFLAHVRSRAAAAP